MIRRLPVYILVDCSASLEGDPIESLTQGIRSLHSNLMGDPSAVESAYLAVITFGSRCRELVPLTEVAQFTPPAIKVDPTGERRLGEALRLLLNCISYEVTRPSRGFKGDWKPLVFLVIGGPVTDIDEFREQARLAKQYSANLIAVVCGDAANTSQLKMLTETVLVMKDMSPDAFSQFFKWVSASLPATDSV